MERPRVEVVVAVPGPEALELGPGWRWLDVCIATTAGYAIREIGWMRVPGHQLADGAWTVHLQGPPRT